MNLSKFTFSLCLKEAKYGVKEILREESEEGNGGHGMDKTGGKGLAWETELGQNIGFIQPQNTNK